MTNGIAVMAAARCFLVLPVVVVLCCCAAVPPTGPTIVALPPQGKDLAQFRQEDATCRGYAQQQLGAPPAAGSAAPTTAQLQQSYDIAYAQCMSASGSSLQSLAMFWPYGPFGYPYPYPGFYGSWFDTAFAVGFFGGFPHHFHRHFGFVHHGFRRG
jgi:hypothetical protein